MEVFKSFIFIYSIFTLLCVIFGLTSGSAFPNITLPGEWTLFSIISFVGNLFTFILTLLFYSTSYMIIDVILWALRIASIFEIGLYFKKLVNPVAN